MMGLEGAQELVAELIQPPANWPNFQAIAPVLDLVLERISCIPSSDSLDDELILTIPLLRAFCQSAIERCTDNSHENVNQTDRIQITQYPVYSMLNNLAQRYDRQSKERIHLAALCILAIYRGIRPPGMDTSRTMPSNNIDSGCRAIRLLSEQVIQRPGKHLTDLPSSYRVLVLVGEKVKADLSVNENSYLSSIRRLIGLSLGEETVLHRESGSTREHQRLANPGSTLLNPSVTSNTRGSEKEFEAVTVRMVPAMDPALVSIVDEARIHGASADDVVKTTTLVKATGRQSSKNGDSVARSMQNQRHIANQIRRSAQHLSMQWNRLSEYEVWVLLSHVSALSGGMAERSACIMLALSLITGRQPKTLRSIRLYNRSADVPASISEHTIDICRETREWIGMAPAPENIRPVSIDWQRNLIQTRQRIRMPIPTQIWELLNTFFSNLAVWKGRPLIQLTDESDTEATIAQVLSELRRSRNVRLTPVRISRHIFHTIADRGGDVVEATLITRVHPSSAQLTGLNYYCVSESSLQQAYLNAVRTLPFPNSSDSSLTPMSLNLDTPIFIGSRFCPKRHRLPLLVNDLRSVVASLRDMHMSEHGFADFHNAYTAYTAFLVLFATGYRSVHGLFSRETDLDTESEFLVIADKVRDDMNHTRIVPTPQILRDQLSMYKRHRRAVSDRLYLLSRQPEPSHQFFWIHAKTLKVTTVTPTNMSERFGDFFNLPLNSNRHFLRSELRAHRVSALLVDTFMGHWTDGCEPFGRYSSLSPAEYREKLLPVLTSILADMGWSAIEGLT